MSTDEIPLAGGRSTAGVVRVGMSVRRPRAARADYIEAALEQLDRAGVAGVPRLHGHDEGGRQILDFIEGDVPQGELAWTDAHMRALGRLLRAVHDALAGHELAGRAQTVCHRDCAPWNTVVRDGQIVGLIDFDEAAPGTGSEDVAYALWTFLDLGPGLGEPGTPAFARARVLALELCVAYGFDEDARHELPVSILAEQARILAFRRRQAGQTGPQQAFAAERVEEIKAQMRWTGAYAAELLA